MPIKNECRCDNPPGGHGLCEAHQLAICRNNGIQCTHECRDRPDILLTREQVDSWIFLQVTGTGLRGPLSPTEEAIVRSGRYQDPATGETVTFEFEVNEPGGAPGAGNVGGTSNEGGAASAAG